MTNDSVMFRGSEFKNRLKEIAYLYIIYILYINMTKIEHILKMSRTNHDCHNCHICHHLEARMFGCLENNGYLCNSKIKQ